MISKEIFVDDAIILYQSGEWGIFESKNMRDYWGEHSKVLHLIHLPCRKKHAAQCFGACYPIYKGNLSKSCDYCAEQPSVSEERNLARVCIFTGWFKHENQNQAKDSNP